LVGRECEGVSCQAGVANLGCGGVAPLKMSRRLVVPTGIERGPASLLRLLGVERDEAAVHAVSVRALPEELRTKIRLGGIEPVRVGPTEMIVELPQRYEPLG